MGVVVGVVVPVVAPELVANTNAATSTIDPPGASAHCRAAARPATTANAPIAADTAIVPRNEWLTTRPVATGSTMSAAMRSTPTTRIAATTVTAVSTASSALPAPTGMPATRADSSSTTIANSARPNSAIAATIPMPRMTITRTSDASIVRIDPNRYGTIASPPLPARLASTTPAAMPP